MISLLSRLFIEDYKNLKDLKVRQKYGFLCGIVGIFFNIFLFAIKILAGIISKSIAVVADAFNNLSDAAASIVTVFGFKVSSKKADKDHPFGHGRLEYVSALIVSILIILMGIELLKSSVDAIKNPKVLQTSFYAILILIISIVVKLYMFIYNNNIGKKISSMAMQATGKDSLNDVISTFAVLLVIVVYKIFPSIKVPLDGIAGIIVACFVLKSGIESIIETVDPLIGLPADKEFVKEVEKEILSFKPICGIHDLIVHDYGPGRMIISLHAEVPGDKNIFEIHDVIDLAEVSVSKKFNCMVTIHMDPIDINNPERDVIKDIVTNELKKLGKDFTMHDLRIVPGESHTNVIFDIVKPYECEYSDNEVIEKISSKIKEYKANYNSVIHIDSPFV